VERLLPAEDGMEKARSPEERRRLSLAREAVYTAAMLGVDVQRRFLVRQRLLFTLAIGLGLGAMWAVAWAVEITPKLGLRWPLFLAALALLGMCSVGRRIHRVLHLGGFFLGWLALGGALGTFSLTRAFPIPLLNPTVLVLVVLLGSVVNTAWVKREFSSFSRFLLLGPWLGLGLVVCYLWLPAGEWVLLWSGSAAILLAFVLHFSGPLALQSFTPGQVLTAAADVIPMLFVAGWNSFTGRG
jgi:FtsH-binding integral membrane protein